MSLSSLFGKPKIPLPPVATPKPVQNTQLDAQMAALGRRQGLMGALFGYKTPSSTTGGGRSLTGGNKS